MHPPPACSIYIYMHMYVYICIHTHVPLQFENIHEIYVPFVFSKQKVYIFLYVFQIATFLKTGNIFIYASQLREFACWR